jgi:hypothetical protein
MYRTRGAAATLVFGMLLTGGCGSGGGGDPPPPGLGPADGNGAPPPAPPSIPPPPVLPTRAAIQAGGPSLVATSGLAYAADAWFEGGSAAQTDGPISGTPDDGLYQAARRGEFGYAIPLADGRYRMTLHLADHDEAYTGAGRSFDVLVEAGEPGEQAIGDVDIQAAVGPRAAYDIERIVDVRGGSLDLRFVRQTGEPSVAGIRVVPEDEPVPAVDRIGDLRTEALRRLQGTAQVACTDAPGVPEEFRIDDTAIALGDLRLPFATLAALQLGASFDGLLRATASGPNDEPLQIRAALSFTLDAAGRLSRVRAWRAGPEQDVERSCAPVAVPAPWGDYGGDAKRFVDGIEKPRPSYPTTMMDCQTFVGRFWDGPMTVDYRDHTLAFRSAEAWTSYGPVPFWQDRQMDPVPLETGFVLAGADLVRFERSQSAERQDLFSVDADHRPIGASTNSRTFFINCAQAAPPNADAARSAADDRR